MIFDQKPGVFCRRYVKGIRTMANHDLQKHSFEVSSTILFALTMVCNLFNYLYQIIMGNLLTTAQYGTMNALFSLVTLIGVPMEILRLTASKYTAHYMALEESRKISKLLKKLMGISAGIALLVLVVGMSLAPWVADILQIENVGYVRMAILVAAVSCLSPVLMGTLQGLQWFTAYSIQNIFNSAGKLVFGVALVWFGVVLYGNLMGIMLGWLLGILYAAYVLRGFWKVRSSETVTLGRQDILRYLSTAFWAQMLTLALTNGDVLLVKAFAANEEVTGIYSSAMTLGKIPIFASSAIVAVLFPVVAAQQAVGKDTLKVFKKALLYGGSISAMCMAGLILFGKQVVLLLFGQRYADAIALMVPVGCFILPLTFITILMNYLTALGNAHFLAATLGGGFVMIVILVGFFHETAAQMLYIMGGVLAVVTIANLVKVFCFDTRHTET